MAIPWMILQMPLSSVNSKGYAPGNVRVYRTINGNDKGYGVRKRAGNISAFTIADNPNGYSRSVINVVTMNGDPSMYSSVVEFMIKLDL